MKHYLSAVLLTFLMLDSSSDVSAQSQQKYNWATWQDFHTQTALGVIRNGRENITVTMLADYLFNSTPRIYNYPAFNSFNGFIPNATVPRTSWTDGSTTGTTKMSFNKVVTNPVLLISSLGRTDIPVILNFSCPYTTVFDGGGMTYINDTIISGQEGYAIIMFKGNIKDIYISSNNPEDYSNITWGMVPAEKNKKIGEDQFVGDQVKPKLRNPNKVDSNTDSLGPSARSTRILDTLHVESSRIVIEMWDGNEIDGDSISLYHNGKKVVSNRKLTKDPITFIINADKTNKTHEIMFVAENLGAIPPNTAFVRVTCGERIYDVRPKTDFQKNEALIIIYQGE